MPVDERLEQNEALVVWQWRFEQAMNAGLERWQACEFADGRGDVEQLRELARRGVLPETIARIMI